METAYLTYPQSLSTNADRSPALPLPHFLPAGEARLGPPDLGRRLSSAPVEAIVQPVVEAMQDWIVRYGYVAIFLLMLAESACIPFPSEVTMLVGGWYSATGDLNFFWVGTWGVLGNLCGSWIAYAVGRSTGRALLDRYGRYILIRSHDIDRAEVWWERYGEAATFFSRLLPVIRTFISLPAGIARMPFARFSVYTFLGVIPWTFALAWVGVEVKDNWEEVVGYFDLPTLIIAGLLVAGAVWWYLRRRRRRRLPRAGASEAD
jgi:LPXTG-motif cell wall-anchored protein